MYRIIQRASILSRNIGVEDAKLGLSISAWNKAGLPLCHCRVASVTTYSSHQHPLRRHSKSRSTVFEAKHSQGSDRLLFPQQNCIATVCLYSTDQDDKPLGLIQRFKEAYKEYGKVLVGVHGVTSAVWFGSFYYAAYSGIDIVPLLQSLGFGEKVIGTFTKAGVGNVAVAYLLYKIATPARYFVTIGSTKLLVKQLRSRGFMEQVPEGSRFRDLASDMREGVKDRVEDRMHNVKDKMQDKYDTAKDNLKDKADEWREDIKENIQDKYEHARDRVKDRHKVVDKMKGKLSDNLKETVEGTKDNVDKLKSKVKSK